MKVILSAGLIVNFLIKKKKKKREGRKNAMKLVTRLLSKKQCMYVSVICHASTVLAVPCFE
jgi:hypothetical protein